MSFGARIVLDESVQVPPSVFGRLEGEAVAKIIEVVFGCELLTCSAIASLSVVG